MNAHERFDLSGKVAWIIGGGGVRLGGAVSRAVAEHGAKAIICDCDVAGAERVADEIRSKGGAAETYTLDITDEYAVSQCADYIQDNYGRMDVMINMAAGSRNEGEGIGLPLDKWTWGVNVTLTGAFLASREAGRIMRKNGTGSIIQFSSMYGKVSPRPEVYPEGMPVNPVDYGAAKAGVLQLVRYQAVALAPFGVRVNAVVPGPFPGTEKYPMDPEFLRNLAREVPMGRVGEMDEISGAVILLCSDASTYMTGSEIVVDGGWLAW